MSQSRGATSLDLKKAEHRLADLAASSTITNIKQALGPESDLHLVGGCVRDAFLGVDTRDIDIATILRPEQICHHLDKAKIRWVPTGIEHGTILAIHEENEVEITTFRMPGPRIITEQSNAFSDSIQIDLSGRDFTINGIAYSIQKNTVVDPFNGIEDLKLGIIRAIDNPDERFKEDPLRILRMIRFGPAQSREIEPKTWESATKHVLHLEKISIERIRDEFLNILLSDYPANSFRALKDLKILDLILPEIVPTYDFEQNEYHRFDLFEHTLAVIENAPPNEIQRLTALLHDLGKVETLSIGETGRRHFYKHEIKSTEITKKVLKRLRFSADIIKTVALLVRLHMRPLECGPAGVRRLINELGPHFEEWLTFKEADALGAKVSSADFANVKEKFLEIWQKENQRRDSFMTLAINGDDLKALGILPGPAMGNILKGLQALVMLDPELNEREKLLELVQERFIVGNIQEI